MLPARNPPPIRCPIPHRIRSASRLPKSYNRSNMQPAFSTPFPEPLPAAMPQLSEKPRHGVRSWNPAPHPGHFLCNSRTAIGLQFGRSGNVSGTVVAPNNGTQNKKLQCAEEALKNNGVALALDAASLGVDAFGPEAQYAKLGIGLGLSTAATINSAVHQDMTGAGLGMASYLKAPTELAATSAGWGWAKWIPGAGVLMDGYSAYHDVSATISDYNACMAKP